ncbi:MAG: GspH/FimT family pseudopilin [Patescibacteria group bacterium]
MKSRAIFNGRAFTLVELVIVMGIMLATLVAATPIYGNLYFSTQLDEAKSDLIQKFRTARQRAVAGFDNKTHGVYLDINFSGTQDRYILYSRSGTSYGTADPTDTIVVLDQALQLERDPAQLSSADINFTKGGGAPSVNGTFTIRHVSEGIRTIRITPLGLIREQ